MENLFKVPADESEYNKYVIETLTKCIHAGYGNKIIYVG